MSAVSLTLTRRSFLATSVAIAALGLVLAAPSFAQTVRAADAETSATNPLRAKHSAAAEDRSIRARRGGQVIAQRNDHDLREERTWQI